MAKIMLVEDDVTMRSLLKTLLEMEGHKAVVWYGDAQSLLEELRHQKPDLLLMDVHLAGGVNGIDLLDSIRQDPDLKNIRIVMSSGMNYAQEAHAAGAFFLQKPYMVNDFLQIIHEALET